MADIRMIHGLRLGLKPLGEPGFREPDGDFAIQTKTSPVLMVATDSYEPS